MCGITGFADIRQSKNSYDSKRIIGDMTDILKSRGPDDKGIWKKYWNISIPIMPKLLWLVFAI